MSEHWYFHADEKDEAELERLAIQANVYDPITAATAVGKTLASSVGGLALLQFGYEGLGILSEVLGNAAALVFQLLAIDPTKKHEVSTEVKGKRIG